MWPMHEWFFRSEELEVVQREQEEREDRARKIVFEGVVLKDKLTRGVTNGDVFVVRVRRVWIDDEITFEVVQVNGKVTELYQVEI